MANADNEQISRRAAIGKIGGFIGGTTVILNSPLRAATKFPRIEPIIIIGAGLAGLTASYELKKAGIRSTIFEAANRPGGRILVNRNHFADGQPAELGAEFIGKNDTDILQLIRELNLELEKDPHNKSNNVIYATKNATHPFQRLCRDFANIKEQIAKDQKTYEQIPAYLENVRLNDYLKKIDTKQRLFSILKTIFSCENGIPIKELSVNNLFEKFRNNPQENCFLPRWNMMSNNYRLKNATDSLINQLMGKVIDQIFFNSQLTRIEQNKNGIFLTINKKEKIRAQKVILTLPFTALRKVKIKKSQWSKNKLNAIKSLKYGIGGKYLFQLTDNTPFRGLPLRLMNDQLGYGWRNSGNSAGGKRIFSIWFVDRTYINQLKKRENRLIVRKKFIREISRNYPLFNNRVMEKDYVIQWAEKKHIYGSHPVLKFNQNRRIYDAISKEQGNIYFAGDHCDRTSFATMNGAVRSAKRVVAHILVKLKKI